MRNHDKGVPVNDQDAIALIKNTPVFGTKRSRDGLHVLRATALKFAEIWRNNHSPALRQKIFQSLEQLDSIENLLTICEDLRIRDYLVLLAPNLVELAQHGQGDVTVIRLADSESFTSIKPQGWGKLKEVEEVSITTRPLILATLQDARVLAGSGLVIVGDELAIHDNLWHKNGSDILLSDNYVLASTREKVVVERNVVSSESPQLSSAIHMVGELSHIFGHWHYDLLPRWRGYEMSQIPGNVPVLIDSNMPPSHRESLRLLIGERRVIMVPAKTSIRVKKLYYVNRPGWLPPQIKYGAVLPDSAISISPGSLHYLRKHMLEYCKKYFPNRRLYIGRYRPKRRLMLNEASIEALANSLDFSFNSMAEHSFKDQVSLVSSTNTIAGPIGSGMDHLIYVKENSRVLIFTPPDFGSYSNLLGAIKGFNIEIRLIAGAVADPTNDSKFSDFSIDLDYLADGFSWLTETR